MGWLIRERRGSAWKAGWTEQTLASISAPPLPLMAIFGIVMTLLFISSYINYKMQMQKTMIGFKMFLLFLPLLLVFVALMMTKYGRFVAVTPVTKNYPANQDEGGSPWGVAVMVGLLLVLVSYQSHFHSKWWPPVWRTY
ncbi:hypothetical protein UlMin_034095 [Ulmus minor]